MNAPASPAPTATGGSLWSAGLALFGSGATLICCALPALMVAIGAGAALAGLVSAVPQLIWLSAHKGWVFGASALMLAAAGAVQWRARHLPCPVDPMQARWCMRLRRISMAIYAVAVLLWFVGALFAWGLPALMA